MAFLTETLGSSGTKKKRNAGSPVFPVSRVTNPYVYNSVAVEAPAAPAPKVTGNDKNLATAIAQDGKTKKQFPSSIDIEATYESDPILARVKALGRQNIESARAEAEATRRQALIEAGLADVGAEMGFDPTTIEAARQNPFSARKKFEQQVQDARKGLDESSGNLFYSGARANRLQDLGREEAEGVATLGRSLRDVLGEITGSLSARELQEQEMIRGAQEEAAARARESAYMDALMRLLSGEPAPVEAASTFTPAADGYGAYSPGGLFTLGPEAPPMAPPATLAPPPQEAATPLSFYGTPGSAVPQSAVIDPMEEDLLWRLGLR